MTICFDNHEPSAGTKRRRPHDQQQNDDTPPPPSPQPTATARERATATNGSSVCEGFPRHDNGLYHQVWRVSRGRRPVGSQLVRYDMECWTDGFDGLYKTVDNKGVLRPLSECPEWVRATLTEMRVCEVRRVIMPGTHGVRFYQINLLEIRSGGGSKKRRHGRHGGPHSHSRPPASEEEEDEDAATVLSTRASGSIRSW
ncbi:unnamed protein product [Vitrella brassicaformis CCMP3155]|uniref:Uncharacterized protein n=1 Tax=Vitrella brassicaformis (strain CCMP3155) TaxID=1169540 RepID=A0A0G4H4Y5_VITBC|nr:unnamed protein product [Vitrella brassicaformis CCMP3155]|eukprot:CEM38742.1 unnamed protein product [Vitrella brassicaformis CCMP3155]